MPVPVIAIPRSHEHSICHGKRACFLPCIKFAAPRLRVGKIVVILCPAIVPAEARGKADKHLGCPAVFTDVVCIHLKQGGILAIIERKNAAGIHRFKFLAHCPIDLSEIRPFNILRHLFFAHTEIGEKLLCVFIPNQTVYRIEGTKPILQLWQLPMCFGPVQTIRRHPSP